MMELDSLCDKWITPISEEIEGEIIGWDECETTAISCSVEIDVDEPPGSGEPVVGFVPFCPMLSRRTNIDTQRKLGGVDWTERDFIGGKRKGH